MKDEVVPAQQASECIVVEYACNLHAYARSAERINKIVQAAGGEIVDDEHLGTDGGQGINQVGADESGASGDDRSRPREYLRK